MSGNAGILSAACRFPERSQPLQEVLDAEGVSADEALFQRLGIESVRACDAESGTDLALGAARAALESSECEAAEIDLIVDYTVLPQEFMVPSWSMSNKIQAELGASKAKTFGFSGGGSSNLLVAVDFAASLIGTRDHVDTALLLAGDRCLPRNRVLNPDHPLTVLGDGASAIVLRRDATDWTVLDTELHSDGALHDVCHIPGGAMAHPDRQDLFRLQLDLPAYQGAPRQETLRRLVDTLLERNGLEPSDVAGYAYPNLSSSDQNDFLRAFGVSEDRICRTNLAPYGHVQANDLVLNYSTIVDRGLVAKGEHLLLCSHGMGFLSGVTLLRH